MDKMERDDRNKTRHKMSFQLCPVKIEDLWRRENPHSSEFACYNRSSSIRSRIDRVYTDIKMTSNTNINQMMVSFTDHYNAIFIERFPSKT